MHRLIAPAPPRPCLTPTKTASAVSYQQPNPQHKNPFHLNSHLHLSIANMGPLSAIIAVAGGLVVLRTVLSLPALLHLLARWWRWVDDRAHAYQSFTIPRFADGTQQENPLYRKAAIYVTSLPSLEDSDTVALLSTGRKPNDLFLQPDAGRPVHDFFLGARLTWTTHHHRLSLRLRRHDRRRVLRPYLQHLEAVADDIDLRRREVRLYTNTSSPTTWSSIPFTHPATLDSIAMDSDLKTRVRTDLESYLKGRAYYHRLGRVWRRSYLLYGPPGTGKSTFVAAMAKFLCYDVYEIDLSRIATGSDLRALLLATTPRSVILIEDLDRYLAAGGGERLTAMLNFMDGVFSCCGDERVMVCTMSGGEGKEGLDLDPALLRPGRLDVHIRFPMCDFTAFKNLASSCLGLKGHKLYPQVEEGFQSGASLSPAEVGEIMITNRSSPSRALKSVITALQRSSSSNGGGAQRLSESRSVNEAASGRLGFGKDATMKEFQKLYGLIKRSGSKRPLEVASATDVAAVGNTTTTVVAAGEKDS